MSVIHTHHRPQLDARQLVVPLVLLLGLGAILFRLWVLQVVRADDLAAKAAGQLTTVHRPAPRGLILDRNEKVVAGVRSELVVWIQPSEIREHPEVLDLLSEILDMPRETLEERVQAEMWRPYVPAPIVRDVSVEQASRIVDSSALLPGVTVETVPMRFYPDSESFSHVLGYVWSANEADVKRLRDLGLKPPRYVGKLGVEYVHEPDLMGELGVERLEVDARGRPVRLASRQNPVPGRQAMLTIDAALQRYALSLLEGKRGAIVGLEPATGEVLVLVSSPSYDASLFEGGISQGDYQRLVNDPAKPFVNRVIREHYSPGSTFKIVTTLAAEVAGIMDYNRPTRCPGYYQVGQRRVRCMGVHGAIRFQDAFARSCNTYFIDLAMRSGVEAMREACRLAGLGERTGIDLVGEGTGIVPTDEWIRRWRPSGAWYPGDTANFAIGQGEIATTPLQMAAVAAMVANRGVLYRPHLVREFRDPLGRGEGRIMTPEVLSRPSISPRFWDEMNRAMVAVIARGTGGRAAIPGLVWGGKTGSTETSRDRKTHSWFVAFAPADQPKIAISVLVEDAGHGGSVAAPIARDVVRAFLYGVPEEFANVSSNSDSTMTNAPASDSATRAASSSPRD